MGLTWRIVEPIDNPCLACDGSGSEWKRTKAGAADRRYVSPIGPCPACGGSGRSEGPRRP